MLVVLSENLIHSIKKPRRWF